MNKTTALITKNLSSEFEVGEVISVTSAEVKIICSSEQENQISRIVEIGEFVIIDCDKYKLIAKVESLNSNFSDFTNSLNLIITASLRILATYSIESSSLEFQIFAYPVIGDKVYFAQKLIVQNLVESSYNQLGSKNDILLEFSTLIEVENVSFRITPERLFGRHLAVLGTTGSGKSWTLSSILEESSRYNCKVLLLDATGEFKTLEYGARHVHIGNTDNNLDINNEVVLPYSQLMEEDLFYIFRPNMDGQAPKLREAIKSLKLAQLEPQLAIDGVILKAHRDKTEYLKAYKEHFDFLEGNVAEFDIHQLSRQIYNECVQNSRSALEPMIWGGFDSSDLSRCTTLINRIQSSINTPELSPIFNPESKKSLLEEIAHFLENSNEKILVVSLEHLSFTHELREILVNAIGRFLMKVARGGFFKKTPLIIAIDEAHQFLKTKSDLLNEYTDLESFSLIAKEGRKYGLNLCLATQRPRDIPADILSQMGNFIVHRLVNEFDRSVIEHACSTVDKTVLNKLPNLGCGESCIVGVDFRIPLLLQTKIPQSKPQSGGPCYQKAWSS